MKVELTTSKMYLEQIKLSRTKGQARGYASNALKAYGLSPEIRRLVQEAMMKKYADDTHKRKSNNY